MVFSYMSNNPSLTLNSQIGCVLNQRIQNASCGLLGSSVCDWISFQVNSYFLLIKRSFCPDSLNYLTNSQKEQKLNLITLRCDSMKHITLRNCLKVYSHNYELNSDKWTKTTFTTNSEKNTKFILVNRKSQHLFNQIRTFRSAKQVRDENPGLCNKMKTFLGLSHLLSKTKSNIRKDLESFQINMNKESLTPEQSQRVLFAFVEGYLLAKESLGNQKSPWTFYHFSIVAIVMGLLYFIYKKSNISSLFKSSNLSIDVSETNVKFSDVKGAEEAKQELKNVVEFLKNPDKFSALGGKLPKGVLLVGPPGTGKTLLAKAVAGEAGVPFFSTSGPEFDEIYVGVGARRIRELFKLAKENIPCVIFIDEIDSIGKERTSSSLHPHANDTINQLLSEMDGFRNSGGIIVLGATNRKEDLDRALLRPGRFDVEVTVSVPDYTGRKELLEFYLNQVRHQNIDVERLARGTTNFTGADIENMVNQAALRAAVIGAQFVTMDHLEYARDKALMGPESISRIIDEETNRITAYHEGGHTVVAYFTEHSQPLHKVTIIARGSSLGHTAYIPDKDIYHVTKTQLLAMLDAMMGGRAAEELVFGSEKITSGASSDLEKATEIASKMVKRWGMSESIGLSTYNNHNIISPQAANLIDTEVKKILHESYERAKNILITHKDEHKELSEALLKYETLDADEIAAIMKGEKDFTNRPQKP